MSVCTDRYFACIQAYGGSSCASARFSCNMRCSRPAATSPTVTRPSAASDAQLSLHEDRCRGQAGLAAAERIDACTALIHSGRYAERSVAAIFRLRGSLQHILRNDRDALADLDAAIRLDPNDRAAFNNRGLIHAALHNDDRAIADYSEAIRLDPRYGMAYNNRGLSYEAKRDPDRAIRDYDEAIRLDPQYALAYNNRGNAYEAKGDRERAIADYDQAIRLNAGYADAFFNRAITYCRKGEIASYRADMAMAVALDTTYADAAKPKGCSITLNLGSAPQNGTDVNENARRSPECLKPGSERPFWCY